MRALPASLILVIFVATIGVGWLFDYLYQSYVGSDSLESPQSDIELLGTALVSSIDGKAYQNEFIQNWTATNDFNVSSTPLKTLALPESLRQQLLSGEVLALESASGISYHFLMPISEQVLVIKQASLPNEQDVQTSSYWFTAMFYFILLLLILAWSMPLLNRLAVLRNKTKQLGKGDLSQRITPSKVSYIADIESEFNRMAERIEELVADMKLLSSAVSHDLRTPLARIRFGIDTLSEEEDAQLQAQYIERIGADVDEMTQLVEVLLSYARLDQNLTEIDKRSVNLGKLVEQCIQSNHHDSRISFNNKLQQNCVINGDSSFLTMMINNLLQNALNYGKEQVNVSLLLEGQSVTLSVEDDGEGIDAKFHHEVLKPFVRGSMLTNNMDSSAQGYGIGLAMVKRIVDWHQAQMNIGQSTSLGGANFIISFPQISS